jgi:hypothetical protein
MRSQLYGGLFAVSMFFILAGLVLTVFARSDFVYVSPFFLVGLLGSTVASVLSKVIGRIEQLEKALVDRSVEPKKGTP